MTCPPFETLVETLIETPGAPPAPPELAAHLSRCARCARRAALVRGLREDLGEARLGPVPARLAAFARSVPRRIAEERGPVQTLVGALLRTVAGADPLPAFRGEAAAGGGHRVYRAGGYDVDVALLTSGAIAGQVLPADTAPVLGEGSCVLYGGERPADSPLGPDGDFRFAGCGPGRYDLVVEAVGARILLPDLELGEVRD